MAERKLAAVGSAIFIQLAQSCWVHRWLLLLGFEDPGTEMPLVELSNAVKVACRMCLSGTKAWIPPSPPSAFLPSPSLPFSASETCCFFSYSSIGTIRSQQILGEQPLEMGLAKLMSLKKKKPKCNRMRDDPSKHSFVCHAPPPKHPKAAVQRKITTCCKHLSGKQQEGGKRELN